MTRTSLVNAAVLLVLACDRDATSPTAVKGVSRGQAPPAGTPTSPGTIPGQYIVVFNGDAGSAVQVAARLAADHGASVQHVYTTALKGMSVSLSAAGAEAVASSPGVAYVEPDQRLILENASTSSAAVFSTTSGTQTNPPWHLDRIDQHTLPLNGSYTYATDGAGVTIYELGGGLRYSHVEFGGRVTLGTDIVNPGMDGSECLGGNTAGVGVAIGSTYGVAKAARVVSVVVSCAGTGTLSNLIAGVDWVTNHHTLPAVGIDALVSSAPSAAYVSAVEGSIAAGVTYVVRGGDAHVDACTVSPSSTPDAIVVASSGSDDHWNAASNYGSCITVVAPGDLVTSADTTSDTATVVRSGSGPATHIVGGAAALYLSAYPTATPGTVRAALLGGATSGALIGVPVGTVNRLLYTGGASVLPRPATAAAFTYSCSGVTCTFYASRSVNAVTSSWNFGDHTSGSGVAITHTFPTAGGKSVSYTVTLTVTDAVGTDVTTSKTVSCKSTSCT